MTESIAVLQKQLLEPFDPFDIEWRVQQAGVSNGIKPWALVLAYVTNRAIMDRLDEVFGLAGWQNVYQTMPDGGIICGISAKLGDEWVTKYDGADKTNIEATKGGLSNAMKRAGVQWGIGRYLYHLETTFVTLTKDKGTGDMIPAFVKLDGDVRGQRYYFARPALPKFALPEGLK